MLYVCIFRALTLWSDGTNTFRGLEFSIKRQWIIWVKYERRERYEIVSKANKGLVSRNNFSILLIWVCFLSSLKFIVGSYDSDICPSKTKHASSVRELV